MILARKASYVFHSIMTWSCISFLISKLASFPKSEERLEVGGPFPGRRDRKSKAWDES